MSCAGSPAGMKNWSWAATPTATSACPIRSAMSRAATSPCGSREAGTLGIGDLHALFRGLGLDPATLGPLSEGELETIGKLVRTLVLGVLDLHAASLGVKHDVHAEDRTLIAPKDNNPLKSDWPED